MNQAVLGASIPFAVLVIVYLARHCRAGWKLLVGGPLLMLLGSLWATVPDLPRFWGDFALYNKLARDPRTDIFLWHHTIDQMESSNPQWALPVLLVMVGALLFAAWRELRAVETQ